MPVSRLIRVREFKLLSNSPLHFSIVLNGRRLSVLPNPPALIFGLDLGSGPATVSWLVMAVRIDSVQRHASGARSHVREKVFEALASRTNSAAPPLANCDSAAAIEVVYGRGLHKASVVHARPRIVFRARPILHHAISGLVTAHVAAGALRVALFVTA